MNALTYQKTKKTPKIKNQCKFYVGPYFWAEYSDAGQTRQNGPLPLI